MSAHDPLTNERASLCECVDPGSDEELELRGLWLSRRMFGWMTGMPEHLDYEAWLEAMGLRLA